MTRNLQEPQDSARQYNFPVKGCMFFGVPNHGADVAETASSILTLLNTVFNVNKNVVHDLEYKSQQLANIASLFRQIRKDHNIPVISFYETVKYSYALGLVSSTFCFLCKHSHVSTTLRLRSPGAIVSPADHLL